MEKAFTVKKDSKLWKNYFMAKKEQEKLVGFATKFFNAHNLKVGRYRIAENLCCDFKSSELESIEKYAGQIKENKDYQGMWEFKKKSITNQKWKEEVFSKIDKIKFYSHDFWWHEYIANGEYAMWDYKGILYGFLSSKYNTNIELSDEMKEIKMSEYYKAVEGWEEEQANENNLHKDR